MGTYFRTRKLSILAILAGLTYAFLIVDTVIDEWDSLMIGFKEGAQSASSVGPVSKNNFHNSYYVSLHPKNGISSYPDSLVDRTNNQPVQSVVMEARVLGSTDSHSRYSQWYNVLLSLCGIMLFTIFIFIPFHFYRLIALIHRNIIFDKEIIRLIRWLGIDLVVVYFTSVLFNYINYRINNSVFSFADYDIGMSSTDAIWLLFGVVVLMIAEILSKALALKEEQELTI